MSINYLREADDPQAHARAAQSTCLTLSISSEDHTMGNALRCMLTSRLDTEFAGYSIPHPTQRELNFRLQTLNRPALDVFAEAVDNLNDLGKHIESTFEAAITDFAATHPDIPPSKTEL